MMNLSDAVFCPPTLKRYSKLFFSGGGKSILRALQYEMLANTELGGRVLDFGGGNKADYLNLISYESYDSINIDQNIDPTWVTRVNDSFPSEAGSYDIALTMNTLEHTFNARDAIDQMYTALRPGGKFVCALPFLYPVHAHPDDYFRPTASWWHAALENSGFREVEVFPLMWGPWTTGLVCSGLPGPFKGFRKHLALLLDLLYIGIRNKLGRDCSALTNHALGYFVVAKK